MPSASAQAPRWTDQRREMCLAAIDAGAHLYIEKPFATDLLEADELLHQAERNAREGALMRAVPELRRALAAL